jgi:glycosyltransferase involved in cell wall biosynthesis
LTEGRLQRPILFLWENFGPLHVDRCDAVAVAFPSLPVVGIEVLSRSSEYDWVPEAGENFSKITLSDADSVKTWSSWKIISAILKRRPRAVFFCHYQRSEIFIAALITRLLGVPTFTMNDSKFDDYSRSLWRELLKSFFFLPYQGAIAASRRSADYLRFLGVPAGRIVLGYDTISIARIRQLAGGVPAPNGHPFAERHFTIVARLLPKKNVAIALKAFAVFSASAKIPRRLIICGAGPLEADLKAQVQQLGISDQVDFKGFVQTEEVCRTLATTLALILPSIEEQFGQVVPEALAMGVPVLVSDNCGARDDLVESGVNGFVFEPSNHTGLAYFMNLLASDEVLWRAMSQACPFFAERGDVSGFVSGVRSLLDGVSFGARPHVPERSFLAHPDGDGLGQAARDVTP